MCHDKEPSERLDDRDAVLRCGQELHLPERFDHSMHTPMRLLIH